MADLLTGTFVLLVIADDDTDHPKVVEASIIHLPLADQESSDG